MDISAALVVLGGMTGFSAKFVNDLLGYGITIQGIESKNIWNPRSFPKGIEDIEKNDKWRCIVRGYYLDKVKMDWGGWAFVFTLIIAWGIWVTLASFSDRLKAASITQGFNLYELCQVGMILLVMVWFFTLILKWKKWGKKVKEIQLSM